MESTKTMNERLAENTDSETIELLESHVPEPDVCEKAVGLVGLCFEGNTHIERMPKSIAAGVSHVAYEIVGEKKTQTEIAERFDVTPLTLRRCRNDTLEEMGLYD